MRLPRDLYNLDRSFTAEIYLQCVMGPVAIIKHILYEFRIQDRYELFTLLCEVSVLEITTEFTSVVISFSY